MIYGINLQYYLFLGLFTYGSVLFIFFIIFNSIGWIELSSSYAAQISIDSDTRQRGKTCRCKMGKELAGSIGGLTIAFLDTGLYLNPEFSSFPILRTVVPALLIPWQDSKYEIIERQKYCFYLGNPTITLLSLDESQVRELERLSGISIGDRVNRN